MTSDAFCYWLHGYTEIGGGVYPTPLQWQIITDHLDLVFNKVTPKRDPYPIRASGCGTGGPLLPPLPWSDTGDIGWFVHTTTC